LNVFISYARRDRAAATQLRSDIEQLGHQVWFDQDVTGGHQWWSTILRQIQGCGVFVFVLSPESVKSRACLAELHYAEALRRPVLPIMVRPVNPATAPPVVANTQIVDYTNRTTDTVFTLLKGFNRMPLAGPLPLPPPPEPEIPTSYLNAYLERLESPELTFTAQAELFVQLRARLNEADEQTTIWELLLRLRNRADLAQSLVADLDEVLAPNWRPDPQQQYEGRYWDGHAWTTRVWQDGREFDERQPDVPPVAVAPQPVIPQRFNGHNKSRVPWVVGAVVLVVAGAVLLVVLLGNSGGSANSAQSVAQRFVDAMIARDGTALASLTCASAQADVRDVSGLDQVTNIHLVRVNAGDNSGSFTISGTFDNVSEQHDLPLVKENGEWKVCTP
jgi:hypothetical protein